MDIDAEYEKLADLHVDLCLAEIHFPGSGNLRRYIFSCFDSIINKVFVK